VVVAADPAACAVQFNPVGTATFTAPCDVAKSALVLRGVPYTNEAVPADSAVVVRVGSIVIPSYDAAAGDAADEGARFEEALETALGRAAIRLRADPARRSTGRRWCSCSGSS
jgi:hypothetical protein